MGLFVTVMFWLYLANIIVKAITLLVATYPRNIEYTVGFDVVSILGQLGMFGWLCYLKYIV